MWTDPHSDLPIEAFENLSPEFDLFSVDFFSEETLSDLLLIEQGGASTIRCQILQAYEKKLELHFRTGSSDFE